MLKGIVIPICFTAMCAFAAGDPSAAGLAGAVVTPELLSGVADAAGKLAGKDVADVQADAASVAVTDWTEGYIEVTALGTANLNLAQSQAHALVQAEETARALAYRKLSERINGVVINSAVTVEKAAATNDKLVAVTRGLVRDAHEVAVKHEVMDDGSVLCSITLRVPMSSAKGLAALSPYAPASGAPLYQPAAGANVPPGDYTGVIIDATGLDLDPALAPALLTEDGKVIYGKAGEGYTAYARTLEQAREKGAGARPLIVKALKAAGEYACDLVMPAPLVDLLFSLQEQKDVVNKGHVVILTRGLQP